MIDDTKFYCAELALQFILSPEYQAAFVEAGGIDAYLEIISRYNRQEPKTEEEKEYVMNLFETLNIIVVQK